MDTSKKISQDIYEKIDHAKSIASKEPDQSIKISKQAYELAKANDLEIEEAFALIGMAFASRVKTDINSILDYSSRALEIFKEKNHNSGQAKALNLIGIAYFYGSMHEEALKCFLESKDIITASGDEVLALRALNNIGEVYRESGLYDKAIEFYQKAIVIAKANNDSFSQANILSNKGDVYLAKKELEKALELYRGSYKILADSLDMVSLGEIENKIGKIYFELGDLENAEKYYFKSLSRLRKISNKYYVIDTLINIAALYTEQSHGQILEYYEKAIECAKDVSNKKMLVKIYKLVSEYHENQGDYKNALSYYKHYFNLNEEITSANQRNKLEILNIDLRNIESTGKIDKIRIRLENEISRQKNELKNIKQANIMLERKAYEDELTGVKNRRSINIYIKDMLEKFAKKEDKIVLFMIDIDKFKRYNDYWGHSEGDLCIRKISDAIRKIQTERGHVFGRYGGEEFVYIASSINYEQALELGELIRSEVESIGLYYMHKGEKKLTTISLGGIIGDVSSMESMAKMMEMADEQLYKAKDMGRNIMILKNLNDHSRRGKL